MAQAEYYFERLNKQLKTDKFIFPPSVEIDLTNTCYQNCYYCNVHDFRKNFPDVGTKEDYLKLIDLLPKEDCYDITYAGGGDPLANKDANEIFNYSLDKKFKIGIITNGMGIDKLSFTKDKRPDWIGIDIDTVDEDLYFKIRKGNLKKVLNGIDKTISDFKLYGTEMTFKCLVTDYNNTKENFKESIELASKMGFDMFFVRVAHFKDGHIIQPATTWDDLENYLKEQCEKNNIRLGCSFNKEKEFLISKNKFIEKCFGPMLSLIFAADGKIYWCTEYRGIKEYQLGDWIKNGIKDLYSNDIVKEMKKFDQCHKCSHQCRFYENFKFINKIIDGLEGEDAGHKTGFF